MNEKEALGLLESLIQVSPQCYTVEKFTYYCWNINTSGFKFKARIRKP